MIDPGSSISSTNPNFLAIIGGIYADDVPKPGGVVRLDQMSEFTDDHVVYDV